MNWLLKFTIAMSQKCNLQTEESKSLKFWSEINGAKKFVKLSHYKCCITVLPFWFHRKKVVRLTFFSSRPFELGKEICPTSATFSFAVYFSCWLYITFALTWMVYNIHNSRKCDMALTFPASVFSCNQKLK